ncbi:hypothetical protein [Nocardiopsis trehalosi]|uniref:hypothetical protein n=1 Tax=Nocardiopsis trehalosi TaxID=109329 RepID=UPI00082EEA5F|nr:hypothetical protein [Nocardiopsis trehalosi]
MNDRTEIRRRAVLVAAAAAIVLLTVGYAVVRLSGGGGATEAGGADAGAETGAETGADTGPAAEQDGSGGTVDVAALLPDSETELQDAAAVARDFTAAYFGGADDRADRIAALATPEYAALLAEEGTAPLVQGEEAPGGSADVDVATEVIGIRDLAEGSVTYVVRATTSGGQAPDQELEYAANLTRTEGGWRVNGFQDAALGDTGAG